MRKNVLIVGGGLGGLAVACRLAARGHKVILLEKNLTLGGKASCHIVSGYTFPLMPCFIYDISELTGLFVEIGRRLEDYLQFVTLQPIYKVFYENDRWAEYIHNGDSAHLLVLDNGRELLLSDVFLPAQLSAVLNNSMSNEPGKITKVIRQLKSLTWKDAYLSVQSVLSPKLKDPFLSSALVAPMVLQGGNPYRLSLRYAINNHLLLPSALYYPLGGMGALVEVLAQILQELGGKIYYHAEVDQFIVQRNQVSGVRLKDGQKIYADYFICDVNREFAFQKLVNPAIYNRSMEKKYPASPSAFVFCFGMKSRNLNGNCLHHNFFLNRKFNETIKTVFRDNDFPVDLFFYLSEPTITDPGLAPPGGSIYQAIVPVPNLMADVDWSLMLSVYREQVVKILEAMVMPNFRREIAVEFIMTPKDFSEKFSLPLGSIYRNQPSMIDQFRSSSRVQTVFRNLFMAGEGCSGEWGISGIIQTAKKVEALIPI